MKKNEIKILIVDDELIVRQSLKNWLEEEGYVCESAEDGQSALKKLNTSDYDLILVDFKMPGMDGLELLGRIKKIQPDLQVIIMTAYATVDTAVTAMKKGAYDYIVKPFDPENVSQIIKRALKYRMLELENLLLKKELEKKAGTNTIIGKSKKMQKVFDLIRTVAGSDAVVMIRGESGTGKELIARAIHANSKRKYGPLISLSCGALPESLLESELFGYEKGSFTGAEFSRKGRIEMADGGTLFLDEIGEISPKTQVDLLRVLQEKTIQHIGSTELIKIDIRIISATNRDLEKAIKDGSFREDLYYRLNVVTINVPPLRERREDIPILLNHFLKKYTLENAKTIKGFSREAMDLLSKYPWPGNVRELENVVESAVVICPGGEITLEFLPRHVKLTGGDDLPDAESRKLTDFERQHIQNVLNENKGNVSQTARDLGIDRVTLYNKMKKHNIKQ